MILIPDTVLQRATSIVLVLYVGAFFGQAFCVLHASHVESGMGAGMDRPAAHASASMAERSPSPHGEHSGPLGKITRARVPWSPARRPSRLPANTASGRLIGCLLPKWRTSAE